MDEKDGIVGGDASDTGKTELLGGRDTDLKGMIGKELIKGEIKDKRHRRNFSDLSFANNNSALDESRVGLMEEKPLSDKQLT